MTPKALILALALLACSPPTPFPKDGAQHGRVGATNNGTDTSGGATYTAGTGIAISGGNVISTSPAPSTWQIKEAHATTDLTPPSVDSAYHDMAGVTTTLTTTSGNALLVKFDEAMINGAGTSAGLWGFQLLLDGSIIPRSTIFTTQSIYGGTNVPGGVWCTVAVSAGSHTVKAQWQQIISGGSPALNASSSPNSQYAQILVAEVTK